MVALNDLQQNAKNESQFLQIDYLLLILSTCGFGFVFICLLIVFVNRKFRNQKKNTLADIKMESVNNIMGDHEFFQIKPFMQQNNEIHQSADITQKNSNQERNQSCEKDETSENRISGNNDLNETGDSIDNPYQTMHEELFTYMYPQIPLYNVFQSPSSSPGLVKPSILITEITSDEERNEKTVSNDINNYNKEERISRDNLIKVIQEDETTFFENSPRNNPFNDESRYYQEYIDENLKLSSSNQNADTNSAEIEQEKRNSLKSNSSGSSGDSDEDSEHDTSSSNSINSTDSSNLIKTFKLKKAVAPSSPTCPLMIQSIADKLSDIEVSTENMKKMNTQLLIIDNQIKDLPPVSQLENVNVNVEPSMEYQISSKFETLQKDITNFLEKTENLENVELISSIMVTDSQPLNSNVIETIPNYQDVENVSNRRFRDNIILSSGDNICQDDLLVNSSEPTTFIGPHSNIDMVNFPTTSNLRLSTDPIIITKQPQIPSSDISNLTENLNIIKDQNLKYSAENLKEVSGSKYTKIFNEDRSPFSFKIKNEETVSELKYNYFSKFKNLKYHNSNKSEENSFDSDIIDMNYADDERSTTPNKQIKTSRKDFLINNPSVTNPLINNNITFPFLFQMKQERINNSDLDSSGADDLKNSDGYKEKNENNDTINSNNQIISTLKNQNLDETKEINKELDDSISSVETQTNMKLNKQTNKNAFTDHESETLKVHNFRAGNVLEAVKLFENGVTDKKTLEFKSQVRYKRKI